MASTRDGLTEKEAIARRALELGLEMKTAQSQKGGNCTVRSVRAYTSPGAEKQEVSEKKASRLKRKTKRHASALRQKPRTRIVKEGCRKKIFVPNSQSFFTVDRAYSREYAAHETIF